MKFITIAAILGTTQAGMFSWIPGMGGSATPLTEEQKLENTKWWVEGMKGYYDGYYKQFYKTRESESMAECLDLETTNNIIKWGNKTFMANLHVASKDCSNKQLSKFTSGSKHCDAAARKQMHLICNIHFQIRHVTSFPFS